MMQILRDIPQIANQMKSNPVTSVWSITLLGLATLIAIELFQSGHTIFGSFFMLEHLHKLAHSPSTNGSDHTAHVAYQ